ncbi:MAG: hypothetical protein ACO2PM_18810 [Pyrobaculum sp.]|jgi:hypothetical protein
MQKADTASEQQPKGSSYVTMKITKESRMVLSEIQKSDPLWSRIDVKDIIALAWPRCPACGGPITAKYMSPQNVICVRCRAEYSLTPTA